MSGFLGRILQGVAGGGQAGQGSPVMAILQQVLNTRDGDNQGIAAIVSKFESAGLGQNVQSWVGTGQNAPVSADQIGQVFSPEQLQGWAQQAGTTPDAVKSILAEALPHTIDHATPDGQVSNQTPDLSALLGRLFGGAENTRPT